MKCYLYCYYGWVRQKSKPLPVANNSTVTEGVTVSGPNTIHSNGQVCVNMSNFFLFLADVDEEDDVGEEEEDEDDIEEGN